MLLTFDNLGEAADLERGEWPAGEPLGRHPSVTVALPRLLGELERHGLRATFFVEAINAEMYPDALREILAGGHELGVHGWRHEAWSELAPARERALLARAGEAFSQLGHRPRAFRPPGGSAACETAQLLADDGYEWWSPLRDDGRRSPALRAAPFAWADVDAYHLMESFSQLRRQHGDPAAASAAAAVGERFARRIASGDPDAVLVLHPFLMLDEAWWEQVRRLLELLASRRGR